MLKNYIRRILIFSSIVFALAYLLYYFVFQKYYIQIFPFLVLFFASTSIIIHLILTKAGKQRITRFSTFFMGSITVKLFIYTVFIGIYVLVDKPNAVPFLICFLLLYFLFTFFETYSLLADLKNEEISKS